MPLSNEQRKAMFAKAEAQTNVAKKQKFNLLKPHLTNYSEKSFGLFENLPVDTAKKLMTGYPNVDPNDVQNNSPTMKELLELAKTHDGTIGGYIIPVDTGRDDSRIQFTSVQLRLDKEKANQLKKREIPDDFTQQAENTFTFWWD